MMPATKLRGVVFFMIDGFDIDYYDAATMPVMRRMARDGFFKTGSCIFPSLTNANNISIACGCWPEQHGVTTNCHYDQASDRAMFLEDASFLAAPTIFERAARADIASAL
ncbi:MAG: alkaline phosphatase family protein, partial [Desulfosarcina sp.]|nr:alkaline phosphatase family protein [Desulfobacterales bacterium]